jgi:signal transduction histidine kinase
MSSAAALAGWVAAGIAATMMIAVRRMLGSRMEAVARACHELRGPLTAARLGLSLGSRSGELSADRLRAIDTELGRATLALQDLSNLGQGGQRLGALEKVDLGTLMVDCVRASSGLAVALDATMTWEWVGPPASIWGARLRLAQALGNLIANAIEHGGGQVCVRGLVAEQVARIAISDEGAGLAAPIAELIRAPRRGRGVRGRGLAIASAIAHAHGGRVTAAPVQHGGRVVLELPLAPEAPAAPVAG